MYPTHAINQIAKLCKGNRSPLARKIQLILGEVTVPKLRGLNTPIELYRDARFLIQFPNNDDPKPSQQLQRHVEATVLEISKNGEYAQLELCMSVPVVHYRGYADNPQAIVTTAEGNPLIWVRIAELFEKEMILDLIEYSEELDDGRC